MCLVNNTLQIHKSYGVKFWKVYTLEDDITLVSVTVVLPYRFVLFPISILEVIFHSAVSS
jgi:hypothetical protein